MSELYPLKFETVLKEKVWGGKALVSRFNKKSNGSLNNIGESWELSAVADNQSVVSNGFLAGNNIEELIEVYMGDITGDAIYREVRNEFPLLIKFIEAREDLSIQVHPAMSLQKKDTKHMERLKCGISLKAGKDQRSIPDSKKESQRRYMKKL